MVRRLLILVGLAELFYGDLALQSIHARVKEDAQERRLTR